MNRKKLAIAVLCMAVLISFMTACSKKSVTDVRSVPKKARVGEEFVVQSNPEKPPKWTEDEEFQVVKEKKDKFIYVIADVSDYSDKRAAERVAEGEIKKRIAEGIKSLVQSQFGEAITGTPDEYKETFESYVVTVSDNVAIVGLIVTDTYWEKIQRIKSEEEVEYYYRVMKRARMPYENYTSSRDMAWNEVVEKAASEQEKFELRRLVEEMQNRDAL